MTSLINSSRRLIVAMAIVLGVAVALVPAGSASASGESESPSQRLRTNYGAIAISIDGRGGIANDKGSRAKAQRVAKAKCKRASDYPGKCEIAVWVRNACGAVSVKWNSDGFVTKYGWAVRAYKGPAVRAAQDKCGSSCKRHAWVCTTRRF
jgi:hypothetical protein